MARNKLFTRVILPQTAVPLPVSFALRACSFVYPSTSLTFRQRIGQFAMPLDLLLNELGAIVHAKLMLKQPVALKLK